MLDHSGQGGEQDEFSWSEPAVVGEAIARNSHSACIMLEGSMAGRMIVLGGGGPQGPMLSIQIADLSHLPGEISWSQVADSSLPQIAPREMHAAACFGTLALVALVFS